MFNFLSRKLSHMLGGWTASKAPLTAEELQKALAAMQETLLEADVPLASARTFIDLVKTELSVAPTSQKISVQDRVNAAVYRKLVEFLGGSETQAPAFDQHSVILLMGLQGAGKTTTAGKLAAWLEPNPAKRARAVLTASVDFARPAAIDQLEIVAKTSGCSFFRPAATSALPAAREALERFKQGGFSYLLLDTPGRLHVDTNLMQELGNLDGILKARYKLLVLDGMTGQESLPVAQRFDQEIGITGAILSKMDGDSRAGAAFAFGHTIKKPILFVGTGERVEDLEPFVPERVAGLIMGQGDAASLAERVDRALDDEQKNEQAEFAKRFAAGQLTIKDFLVQMRVMQKVGSMGTLARYLPEKQGISAQDLAQGDKTFKQIAAIINSMTPKERSGSGDILNTSRKRRIARGAGVQVADIDRFLRKFEECRRFAKLMSMMGGVEKLFPQKNVTLR